MKRTLQWANATNDAFRLQPGVVNTEVKATWYVPVACRRPCRHTAHASARSRLPHVGRSPEWSQRGPDPHRRLGPLIGRTLTPSRSRSICRRARLSRSSRILSNSPHPRNPHRPPQLVRWGPEATDEMCVGYIGVVKAGQDLTRPGGEGRSLRHPVEAVPAEAAARRIEREAPLSQRLAENKVSSCERAYPGRCPGLICAALSGPSSRGARHQHRRSGPAICVALVRGRQVGPEARGPTPCRISTWILLLQMLNFFVKSAC